MIAIVDGGSTKCDWVILENTGEPNLKTTTLGFNPNIINPEFILQEIDKNQELFFLKNHIEKVFFYGSGCGTPDNRKKVADEFTKAFPNGIDKVRQYMENIQDKTGRNTRLVYVSGMKAGLPISGKIPSLWNADGSFNNDLTTLDHADHSLILDRKYWGIQQDTPYKSGYKNEDKISVGTQMMKMLPTLLNKVMNSTPDTKFNIDGKNYSGKE